MKHLDRWARNFGFADFDTYVRSGGSILDARRDILGHIASLQAAITELDSQTVTPKKPEVLLSGKATPKEILDATIEPDEPPDPHNAHPQGDEPP